MLCNKNQRLFAQEEIPAADVGDLDDFLFCTEEWHASEK